MAKAGKPSCYKHPSVANPPSSVPIGPMPKTSMPDRVDTDDQHDMDMKRGISTTGNNGSWTGGRK